MHCLFVVLMTATVVSGAIRCYQGQITTTGQSAGLLGFDVVNCPTSDFCYNGYVKRHHNGDDSFTITKDCGQPGKCFETGCEGPGDEKNCCCVGELCNSSNGLAYSVATFFALYYTLH